jgi:cytochrome c oxidase cbb3-type subunit III
MKQKFISLLMITLLCYVLPASAQTPASTLDNPLAQLLLVIVVALLIAIAVLANAVSGAMDIYRERIKKSGADKAMLLLIGGLPAVSYYLLVSVIALELLVIFALLWMLRYLVGIQRKRTPKAIPVPGQPVVSWWEKLNRTRSIDAASEQEQDLGHDFDGIRELNNPTPPWWRYSFYCSILFGVVYVWVYHISRSAPLQLEELAIAEAKATEAQQAYLAHAANNIDEKTVKLLTAIDDIDGGKKLFTANCTACHGAAGQGMVGPNLTDDYWLHGGQVNQVFSTIKYGVPEKGMKSWKDDFSPKQIAQLASFIKTLHGTNPPGAKEAQGEPEK